MDWTENEPRKPRSAIVIGEDLDMLSVAELANRVDGLEAEIRRIRDVMAAKQKHSAAASALFKS